MTNKKMNVLINSNMIKIVVASYYRYQLGYKYVCTEYNMDQLKKIIMDICISDGKKVIEVEVKTSYYDLVADKEKKIWINRAKGKYQEKHKLYSGEQTNKKIYAPNYFYFAITEDMLNDKKSIKFIEDNFSQYGIMYVQDWREPHIIKKPTMLNKNKVGENILNSILMRISSENIGLRKKLYELKLSIKKEKQ